MEKYVNEYCSLVDEFKRQLEGISINILKERNKDADEIQRRLEQLMESQERLMESQERLKETQERLKESQERLHQAYDDLARLAAKCSHQAHYIKALEAKIKEHSKK